MSGLLGMLYWLLCCFLGFLSSPLNIPFHRPSFSVFSVPLSFLLSLIVFLSPLLTLTSVCLCVPLPPLSQEQAEARQSQKNDVFSALGTFSLNMREFGIDKRIVVDFVKKMYGWGCCWWWCVCVCASFFACTVLDLVIGFALLCVCVRGRATLTL